MNWCNDAYRIKSNYKPFVEAMCELWRIKTWEGLYFHVLFHILLSVGAITTSRKEENEQPESL